MRWYLPTWNGDIRAETVDEATTRLIIIKPTDGELMVLGRLEHQLRERKAWTESHGLWKPPKDRRRRDARRQAVEVALPLGELAPLLVAGFKPGNQTLTAVVYADGEIETVDGTQGAEALAKTAKKASKKGTKAATVKRPTPSCPQCVPGSVEPANEVLQEFLTADQHDTWARHRYIVERGGLSGHPYLIAHRHSDTARRLGRIAFDLDDGVVMHFHDSAVPPEEEVLGAALCLRYREPWLRNQATVLTDSFDADGNPSYRRPRQVFDNPFGGWDDGLDDAAFTQFLGSFFAGTAQPGEPYHPLLEQTFEEAGDALLDAIEGRPRAVVCPDPELAYAREFVEREPENAARLLLHFTRKEHA